MYHKKSKLLFRVKLLLESLNLNWNEQHLEKISIPISMSLDNKRWSKFASQKWSPMAMGVFKILTSTMVPNIAFKVQHWSQQWGRGTLGPNLYTLLRKINLPKFRNFSGSFTRKGKMQNITNQDSKQIKPYLKKC